jgi:hypothetical protein
MIISAVLLFNVGSFPDNRGTITPAEQSYSYLSLRTEDWGLTSVQSGY